MQRPDERRRSRRMDKAFPVFVAGGAGVSFGIARNISEGGVFVEVPETDPIGSTVMVTFAWPGSSAEITCEAEVRYVSVLQYGAEDADRVVARSLRGMGLRFVRFLAKDVYDGDAEAATATYH